MGPAVGPSVLTGRLGRCVVERSPCALQVAGRDRECDQVHRLDDHVPHAAAHSARPVRAGLQGPLGASKRAAFLWINPYPHVSLIGGVVLICGRI